MTGDIINAGHRLNGRLRLHQPLPISLGHFDQVHNRGISIRSAPTIMPFSHWLVDDENASLQAEQ